MLLNRDRADAIMDRDRISAIVASTPVNTFYLSSWATDAAWGFGDLALALLPRDHDLQPAVLTVEVDAGQPQQRDGTWMTTVRGYARKPGIGAGGVQGAMTSEGLPQNHQDAVTDYLFELGLGGARVAFEDRGLGEDVNTVLGGTLDVVPGRDLLREVRMVKTPREMANLRAAARKTELALQISAEALAAGANCAEAERVFWSAAALAGGRPVFLLITPYRPNHGRLAKTDKLEPGGQWVQQQIIKIARDEDLTIERLAQRVSVSRASFALAGTPEQIADMCQAWFQERGADGFSLSPNYLPGALDDFVDQVVPILQKRGLFRTDYQGATLRENLGLPRPVNAFIANPGLGVEPTMWA